MRGSLRSPSSSWMISPLVAGLLLGACICILQIVNSPVEAFLLPGVTIKEPIKKLLLVTDPGEDPGDEKTFLLINIYLKEGIVKELVGVVACHYPSYERYRLALGLLRQLGLEGVPVGHGSNHPEDKYPNPMTEHQFGASYMADESQMSSVKTGEVVIQEAIDNAKPKELTILVIAQLTDVAAVLKNELDKKKFAEKVKSVVVMAEVVMDPETGKPKLDEHGYMQAEKSAHNNSFDMDAANLVYRTCQEKGVQLFIVTRQVSIAAKISRDTTKKMAESGNPIGVRLLALEKAVMQYLWYRVHLPAGDEKGRIGLPGRCNVDWFLKMFCREDKAERDKIREIGPNAQIWEHVVYDTLQDPSALVVASPDLRKHFFTPVVVRIHDVEHLVIGATSKNQGVKPDRIEDLRKHMKTGIFKGQEKNT